MLMGIGSIFRWLGGLIKKAFRLAKKAGLTDVLVDTALARVREAATKFQENSKKRQWVVEQLVKMGTPESIARLAVELAVSLYKDERP